MEDQPGALDEDMVAESLVVAGVLDLLEAVAIDYCFGLGGSLGNECRMTYKYGDKLQRMSSWPSGTTFSLNLLFYALEEEFVTLQVLLLACGWTLMSDEAF